MLSEVWLLCAAPTALLVSQRFAAILLSSFVHSGAKEPTAFRAVDHSTRWMPSVLRTASSSFTNLPVQREAVNPSSQAIPPVARLPAWPGFEA